MLVLEGKSLQDFNLPQPSQARSQKEVREIELQRSHCIRVRDEEIQAEIDALESKSQRKCFEEIRKAYDEKRPSAFFIDAPAGYGKTTKI